ncbi:MAG: NifU family protein [Gemmatimonadetes bacterium]|nr:NifU family protein [Gemmatimonadota bacterium]
MLTFTERARNKVLGFIQEEGLQNQALRVSARGSPFMPEYDIALVEEWDEKADDMVVDVGGFKVFVDAQSAELLKDATIDWAETLHEAGFKIENPNVKPIGAEPPTGPLAERVRKVIETRINPAVGMHGGHVSLLDVRENVAFVELSGGCQGCGMASVTLRQGIETMIKEAIPEIAEIVDVTDHAAGRNPYYQPQKG